MNKERFYRKVRKDKRKVTQRRAKEIFKVTNCDLKEIGGHIMLPPIIFIN